MRFGQVYAIVGITLTVLLGVLWWGVEHKKTTPDTMKPSMTTVFSISSSAFADGDSIPATYTCDGTRDLSPPLRISGVPVSVLSLVLVVEDPDVPKMLKHDGIFDHWILFDIPPETKEIPQGATAGIAGANSAGRNAYTGPCPPPQYEPSEHRYVFTLYALDTKLNLQPGANKQEVLIAMQGHVIAQTTLIGRYKKQ